LTLWIHRAQNQSIPDFRLFEPAFHMISIHYQYFQHFQSICQNAVFWFSGYMRQIRSIDFLIGRTIPERSGSATFFQGEVFVISLR
jgi:hypothetical protein